MGAMTAVGGTNVRVDEVEELAVDGLRWLVAAARETADGGLAWPTAPSQEKTDPTLYTGTAGIVSVLLEAWRHLGDDSYADLALRAGRGLAAAVDGHEDDSLYFGRSGMALVLHPARRARRHRLRYGGRSRVGSRALALRRGALGELFELMGGNGGNGLAALAIGDPEFAVLAVEPYLRAAEKTPWGVTWPHRPGTEARMHHMSHGTLGIAYALVRIGHATGRADLVDLGLAGVADVVARDEGGPDGFLVRHSTPQFLPDLIEPVSYGWCHGPAGDAQLFRLLRDTQGDPAWAALADRCWHTVVRSGLPSGCGRGSGTTTAGAAARRASSPWPATGSPKQPQGRRRTTSRGSSSPTSPPARSGTPTVPAGPTSSTGPPRATSNPTPAGRRAVRASCVNCCASSG